jgi:hypothetical protein
MENITQYLRQAASTAFEALIDGFLTAKFIIAGGILATKTMLALGLLALAIAV